MQLSLLIALLAAARAAADPTGLAPSGNVTVHKLGFDKATGACGQTDMPASAAHFPVTFGGYKMGPCSDDGFTVAAGSKSECSPKVAGKQWCAVFELFTKPSDTLLAVVPSGKCTVCKKLVSAIKKILKFGNATSQECIEFGDKMCNDFDILNKQTCDDIVSGVVSVKDEIIKGMEPPRAVCQKLKFC
jgi:hypothetical protein